MVEEKCKFKSDFWDCVSLLLSYWCDGFPGNYDIIGRKQIKVTGVTRATANQSAGEDQARVPQAVVSFRRLLSVSVPRWTFNWFLIEVRFVLVIQMETFWFRDLLFIPSVYDYFNFAASVIGGYPVDVYLGGKHYLETANAAQNHGVVLGGVWYFVVKASTYTYVCFVYSMIYLLLFQHPLNT